jgi:hypothetical protein
MNNMETMSFPDKQKRDEVFQDLRANGDEFEQQVVRWSDVEVVKPAGFADINGRLVETRPIYRDVWLLAYPRS